MNIQKFFLAALTAALAAPVFALSTDRDQAIEVHADRFDGDEVKQTAVYTGNVIVDQGSMQITGARLEVRITPKGYRQATVTGEPSRFRQQRDPDPKNPINEWMHARASKIVYDEETDTVTLIGAAYLSRTENGKERDMTEGERIVYDMRNARSKVESCSAGASCVPVRGAGAVLLLGAMIVVTRCFSPLTVEPSTFERALRMS